MTSFSRLRNESSVDTVRGMLRRIGQIDAPGTEVELRSVLAIDQLAESIAAERDAETTQGTVRGPLHGAVVLVKDNIESVGLPGTAGSLALRDHPVTRDSVVTARLRAAGAVVAGATNLSEWANIRSTRSSSGWSAVGGLTPNPWSLDRSAGGSSSGSGAAVAAGLTTLAIGSETDGSITCPASLNGVVGIKPTVGMVPTVGIIPISSSQDTAGPMARNIDDAELLLAVIADRADLPMLSAGVDVASLRLGVVDAWRTGHVRTDALFDHVLAAVSGSFRNASSIEVPTMPDNVGADEFTVLMCELFDDLSAHLNERTRGAFTSLADVIRFNEQNAESELCLFGQEIFEMAVTTGGRSGAEYSGARERNLQWAVGECLGPALEHSDVLIAPAYMPAWKTDFVLGHPQAGGAVTSPAAIAGYPIVTIPMGKVDDLPVGLSLVGGPGSESVLIAAARVIERELGIAGDPTWAPTFRQPTRG